ncbi:PREDICTED: uncharacterized protein LOC105365272 [Ceratosolen solmsi marchali]|uniref:Uncharacterized protein LOC105365272 n=1 Tax=Ceratosolen solmsi marchali TaxID=326594 RepID=A0AAJ7DZ35_9HYME|nr:PREDICTED: uncharacterized protein LOC105365272 [Ceratosolen solmsi marchali]
MKKVTSNLVLLPISLLICIFVGIKCQENAMKNLSPSLIECYDGDTYKKWNLLPHNIDTLVAILRKIEDFPGLNMDLRILLSTLLHRFRQDGIVKNPKVKAQVGVMPYAPLGQQFFRHAQTLRVIPGSAVNFPNDSISALERCTLHSMLSSSIDIFERGDESRVCKFSNYGYQRYSRSTSQHKGVKSDVETLSPEQLEILSKTEGGVDPNFLYPPLPPNHPNSARLTNLPPRSRCPIENGIVRTPYGTISAGLVLAGIAAGLEPQMIRVNDLIKQRDDPQVLNSLSEVNLDNKFFGTLAGDLAEVALIQGPQQSDHFNLGVDGNWNSTTQPRYYFLNANENLQMTAAELRGGIDGLVLASQVPIHYSRFGNLKLSQIFDMYYSNKGFFDPNNRACDRRTHLPNVAPINTLTSQTYSAAVILSTEIAKATFFLKSIEKFSTQAVKDFSTFITTMNNDMICNNTHGALGMIDEPAVDLTIILDTTWPFDVIQQILGQLLENLDISKYNSNFTIINAHDGTSISNSSNSILDFHIFNSSNYETYAKGFDLPRAFERLRSLQIKKLNDEQRLGWAGGKSDVVLIIPYQSSISQSDKEFCYEALKIMREEVPDSVILFLTYGPKDRWSDLVLNPDTDVISISVSEIADSYSSIDALPSRIKQVPRRLINSQCGANYEQIGTSRPMINVIGSRGIAYYRIHPNYFSSDDTENLPKVKIQGLNGASLKICVSRELQNTKENVPTTTSTSCTTITSNTYTLSMTCEGASYLHQCKPYYISISSNSTNTGPYTCTDTKICRYPDSIKYTVSYENLQCKSGASSLSIIPVLILSLIYFL